MLTIENVETYGWAAAIRGMRNPKNSWGKSDSKFIRDVDYGCSGSCPCIDIDGHCDCCYIGPNDHGLMEKLRAAGTDHRKFMRMITVYLDITAPLYWWKEFDTYKVGTVANSCSTMHKIHAKEFTLDDFSHEHLMANCDNHEAKIYAESAMDVLARTVATLNVYRDMFLQTSDKRYWWQMIQLLPSSYNQRRTIMLNYEVLANMYKSRRNHKLDEWHTLCDWIESLPYSELITGRH